MGQLPKSTYLNEGTFKNGHIKTGIRIENSAWNLSRIEFADSQN